ncbi:hypothetical protein H5T58_01410 [Candidatus Parcubacteria bacterium]|nr:hypothetical protein [Candidatus Parcubacteria bacterium]
MKQAGLIILAAIGFGLLGLSQTTEIKIDWNAYGGYISHLFTPGNDATINFYSEGAHFWGSATFKDYNDNPYKYNVDTILAQVQAFVENGGVIYFRFDRTDSYTPMYGSAGQYTLTSIYTSDGTASFATQTKTNYAYMVTHNYGFQANNQYTASGSEFGILHQIFGATGLWAVIQVTGNGSAIVTLMSDEASANHWKLGEGAGCYTNASLAATGSGTFVLHAEAPNNITTGWGWTIPGGTLDITVNYNNGFNVTGINMRGS